MARRTIAELAQRKADLLAELDDINTEIVSRAGEADPPGVEPPDEGGYVTATDAAAQRATDEAAQTMLDALESAKRAQ